MDGHLVDLDFVCFLPTYCFVCPILLGQVGIGQNGQITLAAMVETAKSLSTKTSLHGYRPPFIVYLIGNSNSAGAAAGHHERVGHDHPEGRLEGELRLETQRDFGVLGEVGAVDALQFATKRIITF